MSHFWRKLTVGSTNGRVCVHISACPESGIGCPYTVLCSSPCAPAPGPWPARAELVLAKVVYNPVSILYSTHPNMGSVRVHPLGGEPGNCPEHNPLRKKPEYTTLTPSVPPGNGLFGFGHLPSDLPRETRPNSATLRLFYADFSTVSPRTVALLCTNRPAAPASLAPRRENSLRKRTI